MNKICKMDLVHKSKWSYFQSYTHSLFFNILISAALSSFSSTFKWEKEEIHKVSEVSDCFHSSLLMNTCTLARIKVFLLFCVVPSGEWLMFCQGRNAAAVQMSTEKSHSTNFAWHYATFVHVNCTWLNKQMCVLVSCLVYKWNSYSHFKSFHLNLGFKI